MNVKDAESIKDAIKSAKWLPTEVIYEMSIVEAESFREKFPEITVKTCYYIFIKNFVIPT